ncbi:SsgA family sporulation/cell division regulator [Kitasatospora gansuensis]
MTVRRLSRVPVQGPGAPTVATSLDLQLVVAPGADVPVAACLRYDVRDPYAVFLDIHVGLDAPIVWTFARELLATGVREWAGVGDVTVHPGPGGAQHVYVALRGESGGAVLRARSSDIGGFLWRTERLVPIGSERKHFDLDLLLCRLLRHPAPSRAEGCDCRPRGSSAE